MKDIGHYNSEMKKGLMDKIFFIDKVDCTHFIDYGCADGTMVKFLASVYPEHQYLGYDRSDEMIKLANKDYSHKGVEFTSDLHKAYEFGTGSRTGLVASSILHEIYGEGLQERFWADVLLIMPSVIVIRDMCVARAVNRLSDTNSVAKVYHRFGLGHVAKWEEKWGSLANNRSLVHFLLKYRFEKNWDTEFNENYLPFDYEGLLNGIPDCYEIKYIEHYTLEFIKKQVEKDFGIELQDRTHVKIILERKK